METEDQLLKIPEHQDTPSKDELVTLSWSPVMLVGKNINPSEDEHKEVNNYFTELDNKIPWVLKDTGDEQGSFVNGSPCYLGEANNNYMLHHDERFAFILPELKSLAYEFLKLNNGSNIDILDIHVMKAWPVIVRQHGSVIDHVRVGPHLSAVYFPNSAADTDGGLLELLNRGSVDLTLPTLRDVSETPTLNNTSTGYILPNKNALLIFSAQLRQRVAKQLSALPRYCVCFDILITLKDIDIFEPEQAVVHPSKWMCL